VLREVSRQFGGLLLQPGNIGRKPLSYASFVKLHPRESFQRILRQGPLVPNAMTSSCERSPLNCFAFTMRLPSTLGKFPLTY
jgi:hypothetical protein